MKTRRLYVWHLLSSSLFAIGTVVPVATYAIGMHGGGSADAQEGNSNRLAFRVMEGCSWTALAAHILPEMVIDLNTFPKSARSLPHMRYGTKPFANFLQSLLFAAACVFQGSYYCHIWSSDYDSEESVKSYQIINLIAGHVWLCSGIVTYVSGRWEGFSYDFSNNSIATILDQVANDTYTVTTVLLCLAGWIMLVSTAFASLIHVLVRAIWAILGAYFFGTDTRAIYTYINMRMSMEGGGGGVDSDNLIEDAKQRQLSPGSRRDRSSSRRGYRSSSPTKEKSSSQRTQRSRSPNKEKSPRSSSNGSGRDRDLTRHSSRDRKKKKSSRSAASASASSVDEEQP